MEEDLRALDLEVMEQEKGLVVSLIYAGVSAVIYAQKVHLGVPPEKATVGAESALAREAGSPERPQRHNH